MMSDKDRDMPDRNDELISLNYTIAHEIKAPLRAIDGYARIFLEDYGASLLPEAREIIEIIRNICGDTISLSNALLEYIRIARIELSNQVIDLREMIYQAYSSLRFSRIEPQNVTLEFTSEIPHILGDATLMRQVVINILSNAVKFTRDIKDAHIYVQHEIKDGESIFSVRDNGVGFDMKYANKLFGIFQRMHSADEFEGTGIGLATIKMILSLHQGDVWIEGEPNKGAMIYFTLPANRVLY
jgi:light-regulated signal transduction histidine kinase (bacteriophytochrome)